MSKPEITEIAQESNQEHCIKQWQGLHEKLLELGHKVTTISQPSYTKNFHLTARHALLLNQKIMLSYNNDIANQCAPYFAAAISQEDQLCDYEIATNQMHPDHKRPMLFNGSVDTIYVNDSILMCYSNNTSLEMANRIGSTTGKKVIDLSLRDRQSQLIDAILMINEGQLICDIDALDPHSLSYLTEIYEIMNIRDEQSKAPTQSLMTSSGAIVADNCYETQEQIAQLGYEVHCIPFDYFQALGHGPKSLVLQDINK